MSNSPLATYKLISPNKNSPRNHAIDRVSVHCFVGQVTAKRGCEVFQPASKKASCNYVIGYDGGIGLCVEEKDRSWCTSSSANDNRAITIEVASDDKDPYSVTEKAYASLLDLLTDICERNGKKKLLWFGDKDKALSYSPRSDEMVMTVHRWFANKACPGEWLYIRHGQIAAEVTKRLGKDELDMTKEELLSCAGTGDNPSDWAKEGTEFCKEHGIFAGDGNGNYGWQQPITREAVACVIQRAIESAKEM